MEGRRREEGVGVYRAGHLAGARVLNLEGEEVGRVEEVMLDPERGRISYAILSLPALTGMGDRLFAVPWKLFRVDPQRGKCVLALRREHLKTAPGFARDDWPRMADREWAREIHNFYGERPYWEEIAEERRGPSPGRRKSDQGETRYE